MNSRNVYIIVYMEQLTTFTRKTQVLELFFPRVLLDKYGISTSPLSGMYVPKSAMVHTLLCTLQYNLGEWMG